MKRKTDNYDWKFCTIGGVTRVKIESGADIAHLGELDKKLWTVLSCPVAGLEFDAKTLALIDSDGDGKIRVDEVVACAKWLTAALKDPNLLIKKPSEIALDAINQEDEQGAALYASAKQILANLGLEKDTIAVADTEDSVAIFAGSKFNGDGIITAESTDDEALQAVIAAIIASFGAKADRNGKDGVDAESIEKFYEACTAYAAWVDAGTADIKPYGDDTEAALAACEAVKGKVADWFMRSKLAAFDADSTSALDVSVERIGAISDKDLAACADEIASYPLARVTGEAALPLAGINPAWQAAFAALKAAVLDKDYPGAESITEEQWSAVLAKFDAYTAWKAAKAGAEVEALGADAVKGYLAADQKDALLKLVEQDVAEKANADSIDAVGKLVRLCRDFYPFLCNFVNFSDFYDRSEGLKSVFQAGKLYIDQRCCELCVKVTDMGAHAGMAALSGLFLVYCNCVSKTKGATMNIVAALTQGEVNSLRPGKHAVFYDREGNDWDATVTSIVDNPISVGQAFWAPYRKLARLVEERIDKTASEKDSKVMSDMTTKVNTAEVPAGEAPKKQAFDIAKFAGIFAAIGLAVGAIGAALTGLLKAFVALKWWQMLLAIAAVLLLISGPAMIKAWMKLRKRNISPVLNANGWAMNSMVRVNVKFGKTLTSVAKLPKVAASSDPYSDKAPAWRRWLCWILFIAAVAFAALYFTNNLGCIGLERNKPEAEVVEEPAEAPADSTVAVDAPEAVAE